MRIELVQSPASPECYKCGASDIVAVCHNCGRSMCAAHKPAEKPWFMRNEEFTKLHLQPTEMGEQPVHCASCKHDFYAVDVPAFVLLFASAVSFILLIFWWQELYGLILFLFALVVTMAGVTLFMISYLSYRRQERLGPPPLPVLGEGARLMLEEAVQGEIRIDASGQSHYRLQKAAGRLDFHLLFNRMDWDRWQAFRLKYGVPAVAQSDFSAGFVAVCSPVALTFEDPGTSEHLLGNTVALTGSLADTAFFQGSHEAEAREWSFARTYTFRRKQFELPVELLPSLTQEEGQWLLTLIVQPHPLWAGKAEALSVEYLECGLSQAEVAPEKGWPPVSIDNESHRWTVKWHGVTLADGTSPPSATFVLNFPLEADFPDAVLTGSMKVRFHGLLLSGLEEVHFFYPLGQQTESIDTHFQSDAYVEFKVDLRQLRLYQSFQHTEQVAFPEKAPEYGMVTRLVDRLKGKQVTVKRMIENRPLKHADRNDLDQLSWEISGRAYLGVTPLDFEIALGGVRPSVGIHSSDSLANTRAAVMVYGPAAPAHLQEEGQELCAFLLGAVREAVGEG